MSSKYVADQFRFFVIDKRKCQNLLIFVLFWGRENRQVLNSVLESRLKIQGLWRLLDKQNRGVGYNCLYVGLMHLVDLAATQHLLKPLNHL